MSKLELEVAALTKERNRLAAEVGVLQCELAAATNQRDRLMSANAMLIRQMEALLERMREIK